MTINISNYLYYTTLSKPLETTLNKPTNNGFYGLELFYALIYVLGKSSGQCITKNALILKIGTVFKQVLGCIVMLKKVVK